MLRVKNIGSHGGVEQQTQGVRILVQFLDRRSDGGGVRASASASGGCQNRRFAPGGEFGGGGENQFLHKRQGRRRREEMVGVGEIRSSIIEGVSPPGTAVAAAEGLLPVDASNRVVARRGKAPHGPTVLDLEICSRSLVEEEAMRPETLRPLDLTPPLVMRMPRLTGRSCWIPYCQPGVINDELMTIMSGKSEDLKFILTLIRMYEEEGVRVYHEEKGVAMMLECWMCRGRPFVGSVIIKLGCGHLFHYHCIVWHLKDHRACPTCLAPLPPPPTILPASVNYLA
ncbi:hypothetical protein OROMI_022113 [Orobanche minor]